MASPEEKKRAGGGSSALMGLFEPPSPPEMKQQASGALGIDEIRQGQNQKNGASSATKNDNGASEAMTQNQQQTAPISSSHETETPDIENTFQEVPSVSDEISPLLDHSTRTPGGKKRDGGGSTTLMGLFEPPPPERGLQTDALESGMYGSQRERQATDENAAPAMQQRQQVSVTTTDLGRTETRNREESLRRESAAVSETSSFLDESMRNGHEETTRMGNLAPYHTAHLSSIREVPIDVPISSSMAALHEQHKKNKKKDRHPPSKWSVRECVSEVSLPTTWIGSFMFLLYHIVFSLTMGAAITRPNGGSPMFGIMTKMSASGVMFASVVYWWSLADDVPALYPAVDLFCAPFLANLAAVVDETLHQDSSLKTEDNDAVFLASFTFLMCLGLTMTATLLMLANVFKLANLGAFLPVAVLSGFFSAVGVLMWTLAVKVDTSGIGVGQVIFSGDWNVVGHALLHHLPSLVAACIMKYVSPKSPFYVVACILATISLVYLYMGVARVGLEDMVQAGWFWSKDDLTNRKMDAAHVGFVNWAPPAPAGWINSWVQGKVHWGAVQAGMSTTIALAFLYMIRCSLHGAALRKNIGLMERFEEVDTTATDNTADAHSPTRRSSIASVLGNIPPPVRYGRRQVSEFVDLHGSQFNAEGGADDVSESPSEGKKLVAIQSQPTQHALTEILAQYSYSQYICALVGGFAMTPSIGPSSTMYSLGAEAVAPQVGAVILLSVFFFTNFQLVMFIPKPAFSSVLCLASIDIMDGWFIKSYQKTRSKVEWLVNPFILATAFILGLLNAVFLGIAMSTFFFVASFYQSGVVKYVANGITMQSTVERPINMAQWLEENGDLVQILVLQSYLFFGNASSVLNYVSSMFEEAGDDEDEMDARFLPPIPKIVILDFSLVAGMDGSAVDVMADISAVCSNHDCKLFLSGLSPPIQKTLRLGGVKPDTSTKDRSQRKLRFFPDLDAAVGKAEDLLIKLVYWPSSGFQRTKRHNVKGQGFQRCLSYIDEQHSTFFKEELAELGSYTQTVSLEPGEILYEDQQFMDRGLFFIEEGNLRIERSAENTRSLTRGATRNTFNPCGSLSHLKARSGVVARHIAQLKAGKGGTLTFRLARIGPGWVIGEHEALSGLMSPGTTVAVDHCRLHYISYKKLEEVEQEKPMLILKLYKLLSKLHALRSEVTIGQLATLRNIMSAPAHNRPLTNRSPLAKFS